MDPRSSRRVSLVAFALTPLAGRPPGPTRPNRPRLPFRWRRRFRKVKSFFFCQSGPGHTSTACDASLPQHLDAIRDTSFLQPPSSFMFTCIDYSLSGPHASRLSLMIVLVFPPLCSSSSSSSSSTSPLRHLQRSVVLLPTRTQAPAMQRRVCCCNDDTSSPPCFSPAPRSDLLTQTSYHPLVQRT